MTRWARDLVVLLAWVLAGAILVIVVGLVVVPAFWSMSHP